MQRQMHFWQEKEEKHQETQEQEKEIWRCYWLTLENWAQFNLRRSWRLKLVTRVQPVSWAEKSIKWKGYHRDCKPRDHQWRKSCQILEWAQANQSTERCCIDRLSYHDRRRQINAASWQWEPDPVKFQHGRRTAFWWSDLEASWLSTYHWNA